MLLLTAISQPFPLKGHFLWFSHSMYQMSILKSELKLLLSIYLPCYRKPTTICHDNREGELSAKKEKFMTDIALDLTALKMAIRSLIVGIKQPKNEFTRDAVILRFEYTFELSWKMIKH